MNVSLTTPSATTTSRSEHGRRREPRWSRIQTKHWIALRARSQLVKPGRSPRGTGQDRSCDAIANTGQTPPQNRLAEAKQRVRGKNRLTAQRTIKAKHKVAFNELTDKMDHRSPTVQVTKSTGQDLAERSNCKYRANPATKQTCRCNAADPLNNHTSLQVPGKPRHKTDLQRRSPAGQIPCGYRSRPNKNIYI